MQYALCGIINSLGKQWFVWRLNTTNTSEIGVINFHNIPRYGGSCADVACWLMATTRTRILELYGQWL